MAYFHIACSTYNPVAMFYVYLDRSQCVPTMFALFHRQNHVLQKKKKKKKKEFFSTNQPFFVVFLSFSFAKEPDT